MKEPIRSRTERLCNDFKPSFPTFSPGSCSVCARLHTGHLSAGGASDWPAALHGEKDLFIAFRPAASRRTFLTSPFGQNQVLVFTVALSARVTHHNSESGDLWVPLQATVNSQVIELLLCCVWWRGSKRRTNTRAVEAAWTEPSFYFSQREEGERQKHTKKR